MKTCNKCLVLKPLADFKNKKDNKDGLHGTCGPCLKKAKAIYKNTTKGFCTLLYGNQRVDSKYRNMPMPDYSSKELHIWLLENTNFKERLGLWVKNGSKKRDPTMPSIDRIDNTKPYTFENIQLTSLEMNHAKNHLDNLNGVVLNGNHTPILQLLNGKLVREFISQHEAERITGIAQQNIWKCLNKKRKTAGTFSWKYKDKNATN